MVLVALSAASLAAASWTIAAPPSSAEVPARCPDSAPVLADTPHISRPLAPGVTLRVWQARTPGARGRFPIAAVAVRSGAYSVLPVMSRTPQALDPRRPLKSPRIVATMNGDYFDYASGDVATPRGLVVRQGRIVYAPPGWSHVVAMGPDGQPRSAFARVNGLLRIGEHTWTIEAVNQPSHRTGTVLFANHWRGFKVGARPDQMLITIKQGRVVRISLGAATTVPDRGRVIRLARGDRPKVRIGDLVTTSMKAQARDGLPIVQASGHGGNILSDGKVRYVCSDYENLRRPRSMLAWDTSGQVWLFVAGTGMPDAANGVRPGGATKSQLAAIARDLGATDGVVLDGGGSTALYARWGSRIKRLDADGKAWVRNVPVVWAVGRTR
jgi:exopolysaccharide biosynthesis protein